MTDATTPNYGWSYPTVNADSDTWGTTLNTTIGDQDTDLKAVDDATLKKASNLSDLASAATARTSLGLGSMAIQNLDNVSITGGAISGVSINGFVPSGRTVSAGTGLTGGGDLSANRTFAVSYGATSGTAAQGNDSRITGALQAGDNLSTVGNAATCRINLGLGSFSTKNITVSASDPSGTPADGDIWVKYTP